MACLVQGPNPQASDVAHDLRQHRTRSPGRPTQPRPPLACIQIYIKTLGGRSTSIEIPADADIETLRNRVADIETRCFDLVYNAKLIPTKGSITSIGLAHGDSILHLIPTPAGATTRAQNSRASSKDTESTDSDRPARPALCSEDLQSTDSEVLENTNPEEKSNQRHSNNTESTDSDGPASPALSSEDLESTDSEELESTDSEEKSNQRPPPPASRRPIHAVYRAHARPNLRPPRAVSPSMHQPPLPSIFEPEEVLPRQDALGTPLVGDRSSLPEPKDFASELIPSLAIMHIASKCLGGLAPIHRMGSSESIAWGRQMARASVPLKVAVDSFELDETGPDGQLSLYNASVALFQLPTTNLSTIRGTHTPAGKTTVSVPDKSSEIPDFSVDLGLAAPPRADKIFKNWSPSSENDILNCALGEKSAIVDAVITTANKLIAIDRQATATKVLISDGVAPSCREVANHLRKMHPIRETPLSIPLATCPQLTVTAEDCFKVLIKKAGSKDAPLDFFGWSADMFYWDRNKQSPLLTQVARLCAILASGRAPKALNYLVTAGCLTALNKITADEQAARLESGQPPVVRPINKGCLFLQVAFGAAMKTPEAEAAKLKLRPIQLGLGARAGPAKMALLFRALYAQGYGLNTSDAINAFNNLVRQCVLNATAKHFPEGVTMTCAFYGIDAPIFYCYSSKEPDPVKFLMVMFSMNGVRQGCTLGSFLFDLAMLDTYNILAAKYPSYIIHALTDDLPAAFPLPADSNPASWKLCYDGIADFLEDYDKLANPLGIFRHPGKGKILMPLYAPCPEPDSRISKLTKIRADHVIIAGACIGIGADVLAHANKKVIDVQKRVNAIARLAPVNEQAAFKLLGEVANHAFDYLLQITPTAIILPAIRAFDDLIATGRRIVLSPARMAPPSEGEPFRLARANDLAALPIQLGGFDHTRAAVKGPAAYLTMVATTISDPAFVVPTQGIRDDIEAALGILQQNLRFDHSVNCPPLTLDGIIPDNALGFDLFQSEPSQPYPLHRNTQKKIIAQCHLAAKRRLLTQHPPSKDKPENLHIALILSRSQITRSLRAPLWFKQNRCDNIAFAAFFRFYLLMLPLLQRWACLAVRAGVPSEGDALAICHVNHGLPRLLDPVALHAIACITTYSARYIAHACFQRIIKYFAELASCTTLTEPRTSGILLDEFTPEECTQIAPKTSSAHTRTFTRTIMTALQNIDQSTVHTRSDLVLTLQHLLRTGARHRKGLRVDVSIEAPNGEALLVDVSNVHHTPTSQLPEIAAFCKRVHDATELAGGDAFLSTMRGEPSPNVLRAEREKNNRYAIIIDLCKRQQKNGIRQNVPTFEPCILSHAGEFSGGLLRTIEFVTKAWMANDHSVYARSTITKGKLTAIFRQRFKDALLTSVINGFGRTLLAAGRPMTLHEGPPDDYTQFF